MNEDRVRTVVKIGGRAWAAPAILAPIAEAVARANCLLVVPGGGLFADRVREVDREFGLSDTAAHWMAIRAMDQAAWLLADRIPRAVVVSRLESIRAAIDAERVPVLAPSECLLEADPLPHSWEVTSDSIAAWVAGEIRARRLVLVKPPGVRISGSDALPFVDPYFSRALPDDVDWCVVPADDAESLSTAL